MAQNYPGPYEMEFSILVNAFTHKMRVSCNVEGNPAVGTLATAVNIIKRGGTSQNFEAVATTFWGFVRQLYNTAVTVTNVTLWKYTPNTFERTFISAIGVNLLAGASTTATGISQQSIYTFRSGNGGIAKLSLLETVNGTSAKTVLQAISTGTASQKLAHYITSSDSPMIARDNGYLVQPLYQLDGTNEAVFKKRFRQ